MKERNKKMIKANLTYVEGNKEYLVVTGSKSRWFKTEKGAINWCLKNGYTITKERAF